MQLPMKYRFELEVIDRNYVFILHLLHLKNGCVRTSMCVCTLVLSVPLYKHNISSNRETDIRVHVCACRFNSPRPECGSCPWWWLCLRHWSMTLFPLDWQPGRPDLEPRGHVNIAVKSTPETWCISFWIFHVAPSTTKMFSFLNTSITSSSYYGHCAFAVIWYQITVLFIHK